MRKNTLTNEQKLAILKNKVKPGTGPTEYVKFVLIVVLGIPSWIVIGFPLIVVFMIINKLKGRKRPRKVDYLEIAEVAADRTKSEDREYDIIVYGATGFTGNLAAQYLAKNYTNLKWAIAGRSQSRLSVIRSQLAKDAGNPQLEELPIIIADSANQEQLKAMINSTRVLLSTVGPFSKFGNLTVALCAQYGTHYIDSTGEVAWVREMIWRYDALAVKSGAQIISCCGLDSIPWDIMTFALNREMTQKYNQKLAKVEFYDEMYQAMSGGTFETLQTSFLNPFSKSKTEYDPLLKSLGNQEKSQFGQKTVTQKFMNYSSKIKQFIGMWGLAEGNAGIVRRSNALIGYNELFRYYEAYQYSNFFHAFNDQMKLIFIQTNLMVPPLLALMKKIYFPAPGQGPTVEQMNLGYLKLHGYGYGVDGAKIKGTFTLPDDPGYRDTARMLAECALTLACNQKDIKFKGGFLTPACIGEPLLKRLIDSGSTFNVE